MSLAIGAGSNSPAGVDGVAAVNHFPIANNDQAVVRPGETVVISPWPMTATRRRHADHYVGQRQYRFGGHHARTANRSASPCPPRWGSGTMLSLIYTILDAQGGTARSTISIVVGEQG